MDVTEAITEKVAETKAETTTVVAEVPEQEQEAVSQQAETSIAKEPEEQTEAPAAEEKAGVEIQQQAPAVVIEQAVEETKPVGQAVNDPRLSPKPIERVEISTQTLTLFSDTIAPSVEPTGDKPARATNDPRAAAGNTSPDNDGEESVA